MNNISDDNPGNQHSEEESDNSDLPKELWMFTANHDKMKTFKKICRFVMTRLFLVFILQLLISVSFGVLQRVVLLAIIQHLLIFISIN